MSSSSLLDSLKLSLPFKPTGHGNGSGNASNNSARIHVNSTLGLVSNQVIIQTQIQPSSSATTILALGSAAAAGAAIAIIASRSMSSNKEDNVQPYDGREGEKAFRPWEN